jgi:hypothetical protein
MDITPNSIRAGGREIRLDGWPASYIKFCMAATLYGAVAGSVVGGVAGAAISVGAPLIVATLAVRLLRR